MTIDLIPLASLAFAATSPLGSLWLRHKKTG